MSLATAANEAIGALISRQVEEGRQVGVQVCVYKDGERVIDAVAGSMGPDDPRPVQHDTLFHCWSTTKGVSSALVHILAERGAIDFDAPVAKYWPAFGQNGKEAVTVRQALSHQAGLHAMPRPFAIEHVLDWEAGLRRTEEAAPAYPPGTASGYHAFTWGWIVGGIVEGATGATFAEVLNREIVEPLGLSDEMFVGIPDGVEERIATTEIHSIGEGLPLPEDAELFAAIPRGIFDVFNDIEVRKACIPSANGHFTARALAKLYAALAGDGAIDGVRLVSPGAIPVMAQVETNGVDVVIGVPIARSIGFTVGGESGGVPTALGPRATAFGHAGAGGSIAFADPEAGLAVAVTLNKMSFPGPGQGVTLEICQAVREQLGVA